MKTTDKLSTAMEDYLEAILHLSERDGHARVRDIAAEVGVKLPTVSAALRSLSAQEMVNYTPYEVVTLTSRGAAVAQRVKRRHELLAHFLSAVLGVSDETSDSDACKLEHGLSRETVARLVEFMEFVERCPRVGEDWRARMSSGCAEDRVKKECRACIASAAEGLDASVERDRK